MSGQVSMAALSVTAFIALIIFRSARHKIIKFSETSGLARGYGIVGETWVPGLVRALAVIECLIFLTLFIPDARQLAALAAAALFAGYALLMASGLARGRSFIECGCGGPPLRLSHLTILRNLAFSAAAMLTCLVAPIPLPATAVVLCLAFGLVLFAVLGVAERLASHQPHLSHSTFDPKG